MLHIFKKVFNGELMTTLGKSFAIQVRSRACLRMVLPLLLIGVIAVALVILLGSRAADAVAQDEPPPCCEEGPDVSLGQFGVDLETFQFEGNHIALPPQAFKVPQSALALPSRVVLTNLPAVGQQGPNTINPHTGKTNYGSPGSCISWSFGYGLGGYTSARNADGSIKRDAGLSENLPSTAFLYKYVHTFYPTPKGYTCPQGSAAGYLQHLTEAGAPSASQVPYEPVCNYLNNINLSTPHTDAEKFRVGSFAMVNIQKASPALIKEFLAEGMAIAFAGPVFKNWSVPRPTLHGGVFYGEDGTVEHSGHGMLLVGYDDQKGDPAKGLGAFLIQNSFGTDWPEQQKDGPEVERGRFWLSYEAFFRTQLAGNVAYPLDTSAPSGSTLTSSEPHAPDSYITGAFQWAEPQPNRAAKVHLILMHRFSRPVEVKTVTVTDPNGRSAEQFYNSPLSNGYSYFVRQDDRSWLPGKYHIKVTVTTASGGHFSYTGEVIVPPVERYKGAGRSSLHLPPAEMPFEVIGSDGQPATVSF